MSAPKRARDDESNDAAGGAGDAPPPPPARRTRATVATARAHDPAYEQRLKLTDVIGFVALNGYASEASRCAGLNRETWRCIPAGLSASDADRVRRDHPLWQAIIDLKHGEDKGTRLGWAAYYGHLARVCELCDWRADIEAADMHGHTPLWWASHSGHLDIVRELLARGANLEAPQGGWTSLHVASQLGHLDVLRELLARGANIEAATHSGSTSLYVASESGRLDIVRELLARGANVNAAGSDTWTPLMWSSCFGHVEVVRVLLAAGADKRHVANDGDTAVSLAGLEESTPASRAAVLALLAAAP